MAMKQIWTMVVRNGRGNGVVDKFTLINSKYDIVEVTKEQVKGLVASQSVTNLGIGADGEIVSTNGAMEKYTYFNINEGRIEGKSRPVVLNRIEKGGKLIGYVMFAHTGQIVKLNVADAVSMYHKYGISNGKIRHTEDGDIISSIKGNFELMVIDPDDEKCDSDSVEAKVIFVGETEVKSALYRRSYAGILVSSDSASKLSKVVAQLRESNAELVGSLAKKVGENVRKDMQIIRVGATKFYIVAGLEDLAKLKGNILKVTKEEGKPVVFSKMIYESAGEEFIELKAKVSGDKVTLSNDGEEADRKVFASGIKDKYRMIF